MSKLPLNFEERKLIEKHVKTSVTLSTISKILCRSKNAVAREVRINGGRETYKAKEAQERHEKTKEMANKKKSERLKKINFNPYTEMGVRISNLEMQIEILIEQIRGLNDKEN